jgi:hypothetical protein
VLGDYGEQVAEQRPLVGSELLGAIGQQGARLARVLLGADAGVACVRPGVALGAISAPPSPRAPRAGRITAERLSLPARSGGALGAAPVA